MTAEELIPLYQGLFYACLIGAVVFALIAVFLFFKFDIRHIFNVQSGRAEKMTLERMRAANSATGRLILSADLNSGRTDGGEGTHTVVQPTSSEIRATTQLAKPETAPVATMAANREPVSAPRVPDGHRFVIRRKVLLVNTAEEI